MHLLSLHKSFSVVSPAAVLPEADPYTPQSYSHHSSRPPSPLLEHGGEIYNLHHKIVYMVKFLEDFVGLYWKEPVGVDFKDVREKGRILTLDWTGFTGKCPSLGFGV